MIIAADENVFQLQSPQPLLAPTFWETYGWSLAVLIVLLALAGWAIVALIRQRSPSPAPRLALEAALKNAESKPDETSALALVLALRAYLQAIDGRAGLALSTEELAAQLLRLPAFLPARQSLLAALQAADAGKFSGAQIPATLLIAGVRDALNKIEEAQRVLVIKQTAPLIRNASTPPALPRNDFA